MVKKQLGLSSTVEHLTTASNQTVPSYIRGCWVTLIGCGGGGGAGYKSLQAVVRYGGCGGGGGAAIYNQWIDASLLGSTYTATVPAAPAGAAGQSLNDTQGPSGSTAANVTFASGSITLTASSGFGGVSGATTPFTVGALGGQTGDVLGGEGAYGYGTGFTIKPEYGEVRYRAGAGGGCGGAVLADSVTYYQGNAGGGNYFYGDPSTSPGANGVGTNGPSSSKGTTGSGGSGSAAAMNTTYPSSAGGSALGYGGGGGGGGVSGYSASSLGGGNGGPGYCRITWDFI